ncbi:Ig-like domain-containing protein [Yersinia ruckeri]|uniref:Ig-like domain-containing protein n=1 Tax=Yersinia ruckeri TaxID=29486 RepID=UPI002263B0DE|nr:Ig-like domain-containing protein [Yersinia ruckeri]UZX54778.1 Ig-like domain-containing protein [Yersinia ruckeri]
MSPFFKDIKNYLCFGFLKKIIIYTQIVLQTLLGTLPLYSMSFSTQASSDITKKPSLFKRLHTLTPSDTLESVASSHGLSMDELWGLNINLYNNRSAFDAIKYGAVVYVPNYEEEQKSAQQASLAASHLSQIGSSLSSENRVDALSRLAKGLLLTSTAKSVEEWLGHIGKVQVKLQADDKNDFSGSELDLLVPLDDQPEKLTFSQFGFRRIDQRNIMNVGIGQRHYFSDWMLGYNVFVDQQISGNTHRRIGVGGELARDYLKLSANGYYRLGGWKNSNQLEDYDERAANGYDIRTEAYFSHYPQLGGKLMYEQYLGNEVALFGINERQKNPSALTASVSYTPFPLVSMALDHTIGQGGKNKTGLNLAVNYEINTPWKKQIDPASVQAARTLAGSRMDLVDRNNNIVLEYRKQQVVTLNLPDNIRGKEKQVLPISYTANARHGLDRIEWDALDVTRAGGAVTDQGNLAYHVTLPPYIDGGVNSYVLAGRAVDKKGNYSFSNSTNIHVTGVNIHSGNSLTSLTPPTIPANATSRSVIQLQLKTDSGNLVSGVANHITFAIRDFSGNSRARRATNLALPVVNSDVQEIQTGVYEASITSSSSVGRFEIIPTVRGVELNSIILTQIADAVTATINGNASVTISSPSITANGTDKTHLEVLVTDALGHPVPGVEVTWGSDLNSPGLEHVTSITNAQGIAQNHFSSTVTGTANITVQTSTSAVVQAGTIEIKPDSSTTTVNAGNFTVTKTPVVANGANKATYSLKVTDKHGNIVPATTVEWLSNIGTFIQGSPTTTDANGETFIDLVSTKAEVAKVTARVGGKPYAADAVTFIADRRSAKITLLPPSRNSAAANGTDSMTLNAKITDAHGNPIINEKINWEAPGHQVSFDPATGNTRTNDLGETQIALTSIKVGDLTLNAQVEKGDLAINLATEKLSFTADAVTAKISSWLAPTDSKLIADGSAQVTYQVVVKDQQGHTVPNSPVQWKTNLGNFVPAGATTETTNTDANGVAEISLSSIKAGNARVSASVNGHRETSSAVVEFIANSSSAKIAIAPVTQRDFVANGVDVVTYTATVIDANNNPVKAETIAWTDESGHPLNISPGHSQTDNTGKATVDITSVKAGTAQLRATLGNTETDIAQPITYIADRQTAKVAQVFVDGVDTVTADGSSLIHYKAEVKDANDNPVSGMTLSWSSNINKFDKSWSITDSAGHGTAKLSGTQAGRVTAFAQLTSGHHSSVQKENNQAEFIAAMPANANSSLLLAPKLIIADGKLKSTLKFTLRDANHNPVSGLAAKIMVAQSPVNHVTVGPITESATKGVYQAAISGMKEGQVDLTATVAGSGVSQIQTLTLQADNKTAILHSVRSNKNTANANGTDSITYTAQVVDARGNINLDNVSVGWRTNLGELIAITKTNPSGIATVNLTSRQAGNATVTAIVSSTSEMKAAPVTFTAGAISIAHSSSSLSLVELVADGVTSTKVTVKVNDTNGNPLVGQRDKIKITMAGFPGPLVPTQFTEVSDGVYTATITATKAGEGDIITKLNGAELSKQKLKVIADVRTAKIANVQPLTSGPLSVGDKVTYLATIKDANDNPLGADIPVVWSVNRDTIITSSQITSLTNSTGTAEVEVSRDLKGDALITATVGRHSMQATAVTFTSGGVDITSSSMRLMQGSIIADNVDIATIQVDLRDSKGNPLPNLQSQITTSPKDGERGLKITVQANPSGGYLVNIKGTQSGNHVMTVSVAGTPFPNTVNLKLVGDAATAKLDTVIVDRPSFKADDVDQVTYTATVVDDNNNLLENYPVSWRLAQGEGRYQSLSYTNQTGKAETKLSASRLSQYKMEAQVRMQVSAAPDVNTTANDVDPNQSNFVVDVGSIDASGTTKAKLTVTLKDKFGNLLRGQTVNLKDTNNLRGIKLTSNPMHDNKDGTYSSEVTSTTKGNAKFIASINGKDLNQQPQVLVGNIIPQLSFDNKNVMKTYTKARQQKQSLKGLPAGITVHWSSDNSDVARVDATTGDIELLKAGIVNISAVTLADSTYAMGMASYQLEVERADPKLTFTKRISNMTWGQVAPKEQPNVGNADWGSTQPQLKWSSSTPDIARVDTNGNITSLKAGDTLIKATIEQTDQFKASEAEYVLNISKANLQLSFNDQLKQYSVHDKPARVQPLKLPSDLPTSAVRWRSSNPSVMNIESNGRVTHVSSGESDISVEIAENDFYVENRAKYLAEVYKKPTASISGTTIVSKGIPSSNSGEWKPVFKGDQMLINWRVSGSGKFEEPKKVAVQFIEEGTRKILFEKETTHNLTFGSTIIEDIKAKSLLDKRGRFIVKTEGATGLSSQEQSRVIDVKRLYPDEIWSKASVKSSHSIYHEGKSSKDCRTSRLLWNSEHHVNLNWGVDIDFGTNQLIEGMEIKLRIDRVQRDYIRPRDIFTRNILQRYSEENKPSSTSVPETLHTDCFDPHYDNVYLALDVNYLGKKIVYDAGHVYWEGRGRTSKEFVEKNLQRK